MRDLRIHFNVRITPGVLRAGIAGLFFIALVAELGSESVTLTTYYPAPSGVYTKMITTDDTFLARDAGEVGIGLTNPGSKLSVSGGLSVGGAYADDAAPANGMLVQGNVGVGTVSPAGALGVTGSIYAGNVDAETGYSLLYRGRSDLGIKESGYSLVMMAPEGLVFQIDSNGNGTSIPFQVRENGTGTGNGNTLFSIYENGDTAVQNKLGVGLTDPISPLDVNGNIITRLACSAPITYSAYGSGGGTVDLCFAGQYITTVAGIMSKYYALQPSPDPKFEYMCCDCGATCPSL